MAENSDSQARQAAGGSGWLSRSFLLAVLIVLGGVFLHMTWMFFMPVAMAAVFTGLFYPLYRWILKIVRGRPNLASLLAVLILFFGLMIPLYAVGLLVAFEAISLFESAEDSVRGLFEQSQEVGAVDELIAWFQATPLGKIIEPLNIDFREQLTNLARSAGRIVVNVLNQTGRTTFQLVVNLFIMLFTMFFFFRDGKRLVKYLIYLSPLPADYEEQLAERFRSVSRATVKGTLVIGVIQGALGTIPLLIFGVPSALLWGVIMVVLSIIPMVGGYLVLYPAAIYLFVIGDIWQGVVLALYTVLIISNVDNLLRPRLVGHDAKMHDLLIFFSTIGGIAVFGVLGFIVGPVLTALLMTMLEIYGIEFKEQLEFSEATKENGETPKGDKPDMFVTEE